MSRVTPDDVRRSARLSRIALSEEEIGRFAGQLESILGLVETLSEVDVEGAAPFFSAAGTENVFRADEAADPMGREKGLANAPEARDGFFRVPDVMTE